MQAPTLNHRVMLQKPGDGATTLGQPDGWTDVGELHAHVAPLRGREWFAAGQQQAGADVRVTIRHLDGILPTWRVLPLGEAPMAGLPLALRGVPIPVGGRRAYLELMCQSGGHDGR